MRATRVKINAQYLQEVIERRGISTRQLCSEMGRSSGYITKILRDGIASLPDIKHISLLLNISEDKLLLNEEPPQEKTEMTNAEYARELTDALKTIMTQNEEVIKQICIFAETNKDQLANVIRKQNEILQMQNKCKRALEGGNKNDIV